MCWVLLMAEALFRLSACEVLAFGADLPLTDIAQAAHATWVDVLALSFSQAYDGAPPDTLTACAACRRPRSSCGWGRGVQGMRPSPNAGHWQILRNLHDIEPLLQDYHSVIWISRGACLCCGHSAQTSC